MGITNDSIMHKYFAYHEGKVDRPSLAQAHSVSVQENDWRNLRSHVYARGRSTLLCHAVYAEEGGRDKGQAPMFYLLNGDDLGGYTGFGTGPAQHQVGAQRYARETNKENPILSFEALYSAGINFDTIRPAVVMPEHWENVKHASPNLSDVPIWARYRNVWVAEKKDYVRELDVAPDGEGLYHWTTSEHFLGAVVFEASYTLDGTTTSAHFVSAFDEGESMRRRNYFLAQLPRPATTYQDALEALKPVEVLKADAMDERDYVRQGDIFAIPTLLTTRELKRMPGAVWGSRSGAPYPYFDADEYAQGRFVVNEQNRTARQHSKLLGTDHEATYTITLPDGTTYARGCLYHDPPHRAPDHARKKLGDGKTWCLTIQNNVARSHSGSMRAWSSVGRVD